MSTLGHTQPKPSFLDRIRIRSAPIESDDEGSKNAFKKAKLKLKSITIKAERPADKNKTRIVEAFPILDVTAPDYTKNPKETGDITRSKSELILTTIAKNLGSTLTPLRPALTYVYGDPYAPANFRFIEPEKPASENLGAELSAQQEEIVRRLKMERTGLKEHITSKIESILCGSSAEDREDVISLFSRYNHILSAELARGILYIQGADEYYRREMRAYALENLPDGIRPRKLFTRKPRGMCDITGQLNPVITISDEPSNERSPKFLWSDSELIATSDDSDKTLVEMGYKPSAARKKQTYKSLSLVADEDGTISQATPIRPNRQIHPVGGTNYKPHTHTVNRKSVKLERTESVHSYDSKMSSTSIRQRIRSLVGSS